jgi:uncharacterized protein (UPF0332 family)
MRTSTERECFCDAGKANTGWLPTRTGEGDLEEARVLLETGHANACVNRLYYACFYAISALLPARNISTSKHSHERALLHHDYVKPGHISKEMGDHYDLLFNSRQKGDYEDLVVFDAERVRSWLEPTKSFIDHITSLIAREIQ